MSSDRKDIKAYRGTRKMMRTMYLCRSTLHQYLQCTQPFFCKEGSAGGGSLSPETLDVYNA